MMCEEVCTVNGIARIPYSEQLEMQGVNTVILQVNNNKGTIDQNIAFVSFGTLNSVINSKRHRFYEN